MKIENVLQRFSCISFLFKPPWPGFVECFVTNLINLTKIKTNIIMNAN